MSAKYSIFPEYSLIYLQVVGSQDMASFGQYVFKIMEDDRCEPDMDTLLDCTEAVVSPRSEKEEREYRDFANRLTENPDAPKRKVAAVCGDNLVVFGVSRMREVPLTDSAIEFAVFREANEALEWLGRDPGISSELVAEEPIPA